MNKSIRQVNSFIHFDEVSTLSKHLEFVYHPYNKKEQDEKKIEEAKKLTLEFLVRKSLKKVADN